MKTITKISLIVSAMIFAGQLVNAQQQIQFQGMVGQGYGVASWNADGTGPEPAATGHQVPFPGFGNLYYYGASRDYISGNPDHSCFAFLPGITGFPNFAQALSDHGFTPGQVKAKFGLVTLGDDEEGLDWFVMDNFHHSSHKYSNFNIFELDGEALLAIKVDYAVWSVQNGTTTYIIDFGYTPLINISGSSSAGVQAVAQAFIADLDGKSVRLQCESTYGGATITGNGRNGAYYNIINGTLTVGNPTLPFKGLFADNQGAAAWDADGTGPEPYGNGHQNYLYYGASVDYDGMNTSPDACLGHFLDGSTGFYNTLLQLQYRGFEIGDLTMKMGLCSMGPDVQGEDWGTVNGMHWLNQYNNRFTIEINNEPIMVVLQDTNRFLYYDPANYKWSTETSIGKVYNISDNASADAKFVALSFLRDLGSHYMQSDILELSYAGPLSGNGRNGGFYEIIAAQVKGVHEQATFVSPGEVSGTWTAENSPYYVDGHLEISDGETLTIEPGVKVAVRGPYHFAVQGCVKAEGIADDPIIFTRSNPNIWWDGFDYNETPETNSASIFDHCVFEYGYAQGTLAAYNSGGAFAVLLFDKLKILNSTFRYNKADIEDLYPPCGGAIGLWDSSPLIQKCIFYNNSATDYGGAIFCYLNSAPVISNCLFYENEAERGGAIAYYDLGKGVMINNTFADNHAGFGGAVYFYNQSTPELVNNILWNNTGYWGGTQAYFSSSPSVNFYYNNISGGASGFAGYYNGAYLFNLDDDPLFNDTIGALPYSLLEESPCFNMGTPDSSAWYLTQYLPQTCLCGNPRICNGRIDMGAYELPEIVGIHNGNLISKNWLVYPNPFAEKVTIKIDLADPSEVTIELFNLMGERVSNAEILHLPSGQNELSRNLSELPDGVYFLTIRYTDTVLTKKLLKTR